MASAEGHEDFALQLLQQGPQIAYAAGRPLASLARVAELQGVERWLKSAEWLRDVEFEHMSYSENLVCGE